MSLGRRTGAQCVSGTAQRRQGIAPREHRHAVSASLSPLRRHHGAEPDGPGVDRPPPRCAGRAGRARAPGGRCRRAASTRTRTRPRPRCASSTRKPACAPSSARREPAAGTSTTCRRAPAAQGLGRALSRPEAEVVRGALPRRRRARSRHRAPPGTQAEFDAWRWADIDELLGLIVPFKRERLRAGRSRTSPTLARPQAG